MKLGFAPITFNNEDLRSELGEPVPYTTVLDEVAAAGYLATELGDGFPRDAAILKHALEARGLTLTSAWCGLDMTSFSRDADLEHTRQLCELLAGVGASFVNLAHQTASQRKAAERIDAPVDAARWDQLIETVVAAAQIASEHGLQATFHAHVGTWVESRSELEELLRRVPEPLLKLVWDVGHAVYAGIDPVDVARAHPERIAYIHLKDVDGTVLELLRREGLGFEDGIRRRVFTEVGGGVLDVRGLLAALRDINYDGWLMVEQDSTWLTPAESARASRAYLRSLGL